MNNFMNKFNFKYAGLNTRTKPWHMGKHSHDFHEIIVVMRSGEKISIDNELIEASEGDVIVFRPGVIHEEWSGDNPPLETVFFSFSCTGFPEEIPLKIKDSKGRLRIIATWMLNESRILHPSESSSLMNSYLEAFLAEMKRIVKHGDSPMVESTRSTIMRDPSKNHSLESLAKSAGLSKFHFLRKYRKIAGVSPADDVRRIRLSFARDLLISSDDPLKSIAEKSGLSNQTTLCRLFQKYYQKSPGQFRKQKA